MLAARCSLPLTTGARDATLHPLPHPHSHSRPLLRRTAQYEGFSGGGGGAGVRW